jgi:hypothetical protein
MLVNLFPAIATVCAPVDPLPFDDGVYHFVILGVDVYIPDFDISQGLWRWSNWG